MTKLSVFEYSRYKEYVLQRLQQMPKRGHGQFRKIAQYLSIGSVNVSQIFRGDRHLTIEQAIELCEFFGLSELESQYFVALVERERAGSHKAKEFLSVRLKELVEKSQDLKSRLKQEGQLDRNSQYVFYSDWFFSAIRLMTSIKGFNTADAIASHLQLPLSKVNRVLEFLVQSGLCVEVKGRYQIGPSSTHLEANSPLISRHHTNWRLKAIERLPVVSKQELCLTMPCTLSDLAFESIRKELVSVIERITDIIDAAPSERLAFMNIDFLKFS